MLAINFSGIECVVITYDMFGVMWTKAIKCSTERLSFVYRPRFVRRCGWHVNRLARHVCIFCPPKEAAGARLYTHYYVLPTFNYYYRVAASHQRRGGGERHSCCLPLIKTSLYKSEMEIEQVCPKNIFIQIFIRFNIILTISSIANLIILQEKLLSYA